MTDTDTPIRLLLVEDNPGDVVLLQTMLEHSRYEVCVAGSISLAKNVILEKAFDVVFVDLTLPDSDGLETVDALHAAAPDLPIVVLTGVTDENVALAAVSRGAQDYLVKGQTNSPMIIRTIRHAIDRKQAEVSLQRAHDELERRVQERTADLRRTNRTLQMVAECNQALVHIPDEKSLAEAICRIIHRIGGYRLVRVASARDDEARDLRLIASAGAETLSGEAGVIGQAVCECSCGPTARAVRLGRGCVCRDLLGDSEQASWREFASKAGLRSLVAFPLMSEGCAFGALTIFSDEPDAFDQDQANMLRALADDLAFAIIAVRTRAQRDRAEQDLEHRAEQLRALAAELTNAEQRERRRLAQVLHDGLQQLLVGAKYSVEVIRSRINDTDALDAIGQLTSTLDESIAAARSLTAELSPPVLYENGLGAGLEWLARRMQEKHGLHVDISAEPGAEPSSEHVRILLFDAVRELLFNVVKHARVSRARVSLFSAGPETRVEVSDDGVGFDPGRRGHKDGLTGGLGLFGIRERLHYLDGKVIIDSARGRGTRITLVIKMKQALDASRDGESTGAQAIAAPPEPGRKIRVLIADDHAIVRQGLGSLLRGVPDIEIVGEAVDGQEAVEMARNLRPDVVIMDVSMPRLNGCEATRIISSELPGSRIVGLSMHLEPEIGHAMLKAGASAYLTKGGPTDALIAAIRAPVKAHAGILIN